MSVSFRVTALDPSSSARAGVLETPHGTVPTPAFMPVASQGTVKALTHDQLEGLGADIILLNSYHLFLRPGVEDIEALGGLHRFISWPKPILTDSGGFQIYSLSPLVKVSDEGVRFSSHLDGSKVLLRPEDVVDLQVRMGTDVLMCLDHFPPYPYSEAA
ncbi:MAG: tRNA-guanine transglycosylase, partial [Acidobacteria bacterium]|nr:tRNA-guanine transglycosylase [Acidobacteriota bacterium]